MADVSTQALPATPLAGKGYVRSDVNSSWWQIALEEDVPELRWPESIPIYDRMRKTAQVKSVLSAVTLPLLRTPWRIDGTGCRDEVTQTVADDLGLPIKGVEDTAYRRTRDRFSWVAHLRRVLRAQTYGHAFFEQLYRVDDTGQHRLRKLEPRPARTISKINVARDGGLISIEQSPPGGLRSDKVVIEVGRLVAYVNEMEDGNWLGQSLLRPVYGNWLIRGQLERVWAQSLQRGGMGVPIYEGAEAETDLTRGLAMAQGLRAGDSSGGATPFGAKLRLAAPERPLPDVGAAVRYQDEQIARAALLHFLNLGTQTGSWALGTTLADFFTMSLQASALDVEETTNAHVIEDMVSVAFGPNEPAPRVVADEIGSKQPATAAALKLLVEAGILRPDSVLEESVRQDYDLPSQTEPDDGGTP